MGKLLVIKDVVLSKNYYVICDRRSEGNVKMYYTKAFTTEMKKAANRIDQLAKEKRQADLDQSLSNKGDE